MELDGKGGAAFALEATLINELADVQDVTVNLVIGVPTFAMENQVDPMSLQQAMASLGQYFQSGDSQISNRFSNAMMVQSQYGQLAGQGQGRAMGDTAAAPAPEAGGAGRAEDLFVFTVKHVTLKKGQRMVVPVSQFTLKYTDVYTLDVPFVPPAELWRHMGNQPNRETIKLMTAPKVMHKVRIVNESKAPLTTAPALIVCEGRVLAQGLMTYTAVGGSVDLALTAAVDVAVKKSEKETKRVHDAERWENTSYARVDLDGLIRLTNHKDKPVALEVTRHVMGNLQTADNGGVIEMANVFEDRDAGGLEYPSWWGWYSWPNWWTHFNGIGRVKWKMMLDPGKNVELKYTWNYFWR